MSEIDEQSPKQCPFSQQPCIHDECALSMDFVQGAGNLQRKVGMCVFVGTNIILSEMNMKLQQQGRPPMPNILMPGHIGRG